MKIKTVAFIFGLTTVGVMGTVRADEPEYIAVSDLPGSKDSADKPVTPKKTVAKAKRKKSAVRVKQDEVISLSNDDIPISHRYYRGPEETPISTRVRTVPTIPAVIPVGAPPVSVPPTSPPANQPSSGIPAQVPPPSTVPGK